MTVYSTHICASGLGWRDLASLMSRVRFESSQRLLLNSLWLVHLTKHEHRSTDLE